MCTNNSFYSQLFGRFTTVHCTEHKEIADNPWILSTWLKLAMHVTPFYLLSVSICLAILLNILRI